MRTLSWSVVLGLLAIGLGCAGAPGSQTPPQWAQNGPYAAPGQPPGFGGAPAAPAPYAPQGGLGGGFAAQPGGVRINGTPLDAATAQQLGVPPWDYWYDPVSGLWGLQGQPYAGQIAAGLQLGGPLRADASGGQTQVYVNGRALHPNEIAALGNPYPGRYWLDASGRYGNEGGPMLGQIGGGGGGGRGGGGGGGDNFWTSGGGSASGGATGNWDADGGYVCTDGNCVTYGW
jgi:hypothetical protein